MNDIKDVKPPINLPDLWWLLWLLLFLIVIAAVIYFLMRFFKAPKTVNNFKEPLIYIICRFFLIYIIIYLYR